MTKRTGLKSLSKLVVSMQDTNPANTFLTELKEAIVNNVEPYVASQFYKPSGLDCIRKMYFQRIGESVESKPSHNLVGFGDVGTHRHETLQSAVVYMSEHSDDLEWLSVEQWLEENPVEGTFVNESDIYIEKYKNDYETKCFNDLLQLSFLCDGVIQYKGEVYILEIKTETSRKYYGHDDVRQEHHYQAACYSMCLGIDKVMFVYENRDLLDIKSYIYEVDNIVKNEVVKRIQECEQHVIDRVPPTEKCGKSYCDYCKGANRKNG